MSGMHLCTCSQVTYDPADHVGTIYRSASALSGYMDKMEVSHGFDGPNPTAPLK